MLQNARTGKRADKLSISDQCYYASSTLLHVLTEIQATFILWTMDKELSMAVKKLPQQTERTKATPWHIWHGSANTQCIPLWPIHSPAHFEAGLTALKWASPIHNC